MILKGQFSIPEPELFPNAMLDVDRKQSSASVNNFQPKRKVSKSNLTGSSTPT